VRHQRQQLLRLQLALDLFGQQAVEELDGDRTQFANPTSAVRYRKQGFLRFL